MQQWRVLGAALVAAMALGCDDGGTTPDFGDGGGGAGGSVVGGGTGGGVQTDSGGGGQVRSDIGVINPDTSVADGAPPDAALPDAALPDAALPDAALPDASDLPPVLDAGVCNAEDLCDTQWSQCVDGSCRVDLRPGVYRMTSGTVLRPEIAAPALTAALQIAVNGGQLSMLFEAGGYEDDGTYTWYIGSGLAPDGNPGQPGAIYEYRHTLPIQNVNGWWRQGPDGPNFTQDGTGIFSLNVPAGAADDGMGNLVDCFTQLNANAHIEIAPSAALDQPPRVTGLVDGYLDAAEASMVSFRQGDIVITFDELLQGEPPDVDTDGDGVPDAYTFIIEAVAEPIIFSDENPERDPAPAFEQPAACSN